MIHFFPSFVETDFSYPCSCSCKRGSSSCSCSSSLAGSSLPLGSLTCSYLDLHLPCTSSPPPCSRRSGFHSAPGTRPPHLSSSPFPQKQILAASGRPKLQ